MVTGSSIREKYCLPKGEYRKKACGNDMLAHMTTAGSSTLSISYRLNTNADTILVQTDTNGADSVGSTLAKAIAGRRRPDLDDVVPCNSTSRAAASLSLAC
jgi:hypothetical protein